MGGGWVEGVSGDEGKRDVKRDVNRDGVNGMLEA